MAERTSDVTRILAEWRSGVDGAFDRLMPIVYDELKVLARRQLRQRRTDHDTLDTTALVHEAYLKLLGGGTSTVRDRHHFLSVAATAMRHILVDHARRRDADKRGGGQVRSLGDAEPADTDRRLDVIAIHQAVDALQRVDSRLAELVDLRLFAGMSVEEAAALLEVSPRTVKRDWQKARAFLGSALGEAEGGAS
jgi:RNA polymerase sigma factor (TIGR02999 family)